MEFEAEKLRDIAAEKSRNNAIIAPAKRKAKSGKRKEAPNSNGSGNEWASKKKKARRAKSKKVEKSKAKCHNCGKSGHRV